jgi:hypothetical protein
MSNIQGSGHSINIALASLSLLVVLSGCRQSAANPEPPPPPEVVVHAVQPEDVAVFTESIGTIDGMVNAEIRARVPGYVQVQAYRDGTYVKKGDLLFTIDPSLTAASSKKARGDVGASEAALAKAIVDVNRLEQLVAQGIGRQQDLDTARAAKQLAEGNVLAAQGSLDTASANLSYTRIVAPISGLAGLAKVRVGSLVGQGEATLLTTISQIDPVRVSYAISEQGVPRQSKEIPGRRGGRRRRRSRSLPCRRVAVSPEGIARLPRSPGRPLDRYVHRARHVSQPRRPPSPGSVRQGPRRARGAEGRPLCAAARCHRAPGDTAGRGHRRGRQGRGAAGRHGRGRARGRVVVHHVGGSAPIIGYPAISEGKSAACRIKGCLLRRRPCRASDPPVRATGR